MRRAAVEDLVKQNKSNKNKVIWKIQKKNERKKW